MTAASTRTLPVDELRNRARTRQFHPGRAIVTAVAWVFVALGWLAGGLVTFTAFAAVTARYGYWRGRGLTDEEIIARVNTPREQPKQGPQGR